MIRQDREDWTKVVGRSLREAEEPLPADGWERLEREFGATLAKPVHSPWRNWRHIAAAAASVLVCVSIGLQLLRQHHNVIDERVVSVAETTGGESERGIAVRETSVALSGEIGGASASGRGPEISSVPHSEHGLRPAKYELRLSEHGGSVSGDGASLAVKTTPSDGNSGSGVGSKGTAADSGNNRIGSVGGEKSNAPRTAQRETEASAHSETPSRLRPEPQSGSAMKGEAPRYETADYDGLFAESGPKERRRGGSVGLFAAGSLGAKSTSLPSGPLYSALLQDKDNAVGLHEAFAGYSYDHKQPLSFGISFRKEFRYGLSLETGLNYTLLRSNVTVSGRVKEVRQELHLIGIPLRVSWSFLQAGPFSMYVGAGGMAEKCVSARFGSENVQEKRILWSLSGLVGAQLRLGRWAGIYFEPSVTHYLTNSSLRTTYTDSKAALDLRIGLRFTY